MIGTAGKPAELPGVVLVSYSRDLKEQASELSVTLTVGCRRLTNIFQTKTPKLQAMLLSKEDWPDAPREAEHPYPFGLPYFTRSADTPTLVFPSEPSEILRPRNGLTPSLTVWHELAHAFFLSREVVKTPLWLGEFVPQAASAAVALRDDLSLDEHLSQVEEPEFAIRTFTLPDSGYKQMQFQNLLLSLGVAAIDKFGDGFVSRLVHSLWKESSVIDEERAEELFVASLGDGGAKWLSGREEF